LSILIAAGLLTAAFGCADIHSYCKDKIDCEGGNDDDQKACIADMKGERSAADEYGCRDEFDRYVACYVEYGQCGPTEFDTSEDYTAVSDKTGADMCASAEAAWTACGAIESRSAL
jgi:hypothetical protein